MRILVACEESQTIAIAMRKKGHEAFSCDIQECSGGHPEWHIQGNVLDILDQGWDMMIAHPPCTYLSNAGARWLFKNGELNEERYLMGLDARNFFMKLLNAPIPKICIENPTPSKIFDLPDHTQVIQPYEYGHPYKKRTLLWLKGLKALEPTKIVNESESTKVKGNWFNSGGKERQKNRSKTFEGIADAMSDQWG